MKLSQLYNKRFFAHVHETASASAMAAVPVILDLIQPKSVIDVGCGTGDWLLAFRKYGVNDIFGIDGEYVDRSLLAFSQENFRALDLTKPFDVERTYDLALCLEVAEHLAPECASNFIESLTKLAPIILFSAAIPLQGGTHHVNEQWPEYWAELFASKGFVPLDILRKRLWNNDQIDVWYRQNILFFCRKDIVFNDTTLKEAFMSTNPSKLTVVHPEFFLLRARLDRNRITQLEHMSPLSYLKLMVKNKLHIVRQ
jgi:SAM-dependent methyltransferase